VIWYATGGGVPFLAGLFVLATVLAAYVLTSSK